MNLNKTKFFNTDEVYISSKMNEYLKNNFGYEITGDLESLREAKASLEVTKAGLKDEYMSAKYVENMLMLETVKSLLKAHGITGNTLKEDESSDEENEGLSSNVEKVLHAEDHYSVVEVTPAEQATRATIVLRHWEKEISRGFYEPMDDAFVMSFRDKTTRMFETPEDLIKFMKVGSEKYYADRKEDTSESVNEDDYANDQHEQLEYIHHVLQECSDGNMDLAMVEQAMDYIDGEIKDEIPPKFNKILDYIHSVLQACADDNMDITKVEQALGYVEEIREIHFDDEGNTKSESVTEESVNEQSIDADGQGYVETEHYKVAVSANDMGIIVDVYDKHDKQREPLKSDQYWDEDVMESVTVTEDEEKGIEHYRYKNDSQLANAKDKLIACMAQLDHAIEYRAENSHLFFNTGDKAGTGDLYRMKEQLEKLHDGWEEATELYGM